MTYLVQKLDAKRWQITSPYGDNLGVHTTRKGAVTAARLLAGWRGNVVIEGVR